MLNACASVKLSPDDLELTGGGKVLSLAEVSGYESSSYQNNVNYAQVRTKSVTPLTDEVTRKNLPITININGHQKQCQQALNVWIPKIKPLLAMIDASTQAQVNPTLIQISQGQNPQACGPQDQRVRTLQALADTLAGQGKRIGIVLPLSGPRAKLSTWVLEGMRAAFADANIAFDQNIILRDSGGSSHQTDRALAELILKDRVSLVIGGLDPHDAETLAKRSAEFGIPTILLARERELLNRSNFAFRIYPDEQHLAKTLAKAAKAKNWQKIAILKPASGKSDAIVRYFEEAMLSLGGEVLTKVTYTAGDFESMSAAVKQLFHIDPAKRRDEYQEAYKTAQDLALQSGMPFDPRTVLLKPIIDADAVFLPDDFRTARHFAKLFKFQRVDRLPMIGNHEWRSPGLLEAFDESFDGAIFADFIGSYASLPASIAAPTTGSPYFINPQAVVPTDFKLIGYRTAKVASEIAQQTPLNRLQLARYLQSLVQKSDDQGSNKSSIFAADRNVVWPTYVFSVHRDGLSLNRDEPH